MSADGYTCFGTKYVLPGHGGPSSDFIRADGNHRDANTFVTSSTYNASPNQPLAGILGATATQNRHIPIWTPNLSPSYYGSQQQGVSTANSGWNYEWNPDVSIAPPAWDPASQRFTQGLSHVTTGLGFSQRSIPALSSVEYPIANSQPDPTLQFPESGFTPNGFDDFNSFNQWDDSNAIANSHLDPTLQLLESGFTPKGFNDFNSVNQWVNSNAIDPQVTMTYNQLPFAPTTSMPAPPALPTHTTSMFTTPAMPRPVARRVASRHPNVNTNPHTCPECGKTIARLGDLVRHRQQHSAPLYSCVVRGCNRHGLRAFHRADKLRDHQRKRHRMAV